MQFIQFKLKIVPNFFLPDVVVSIGIGGIIVRGTTGITVAGVVGGTVVIISKSCRIFIKFQK